MGLVSRVLPDDELLAEALAIAARMCEFSPYGLAMTKDILWVNLENPSLEAAIEIEDRNQLMLGFTENLPEAIRAFDRGARPSTPTSPAGTFSGVRAGQSAGEPTELESVLIPRGGPS